MKKTSAVELGQAILLFISFMVILVFLLFIFIHNSLYIKISFVCALAFLICINLIYAKVYTIKFLEDTICISNVYKEEIIGKQEFNNIDLVYKNINFFIPMPLSSPPYFTLNTKSGKKYIFVITSATSVLKSFFVSPRIQAKNIEIGIKKLYNINDTND